jgi:O-antigen biosynthesis protein WbqP
MSIAALALLSPLLGAVALLILLDDGTPVIYRQVRVGRGNELFEIRKFRTMHRGTDSLSQSEMQGRDCYTRTGRLLRALSVDELPQLLNILEGTMSFVGPRPLIPEEAHVRQLRAAAGVYKALPGLTGWAQVNGRANVTDEEKVALDEEYLRRQSFGLDMKILLKTAGQVIVRKDVNSC